MSYSQPYRDPSWRSRQFKQPSGGALSPPKEQIEWPVVQSNKVYELDDLSWMHETPLYTPPSLKALDWQPATGKHRGPKLARLKKQKPRRKRMRRWLVVISLLAILGIVLGTQTNGQFGAQVADAMRAVLGPTITAQVESWFLGISDKAHQIQYQLSGQPVQPPWAIAVRHKVVPTSSGNQSVMPLVQVKPFISPALAGEGTWTTDGLPAAGGNLPPIVEKTFIRPDPDRPYAIVTLLQFDMRNLALHMIAGTSQPGGPLGAYGPGKIPASDLQQNALVAAFNGGFKYADGQYGMYVNGRTYVPPQNGAATIAITKEGQVFIGAWGKDPRLHSGNTDLAAWRQNASLLIDNGVVSSLANDGAAWGGTILNQAYTWRSGIGITPYGSLIYAAGNYLSALTLGKALQAAGAMTAMQTDINPFWVRAFLYNRNPNVGLQITRLNTGMQGTGLEYLYSTQRDFFYLTRRIPVAKP
jgi:hypothetical protein